MAKQVSVEQAQEDARICVEVLSKLSEPSSQKDAKDLLSLSLKRLLGAYQEDK